MLEAYDMWAAEHDNGSADARFRASAERILKMFFAPGLYENPYLDLGASQSIVTSDDKVTAGYQAQLDSIVMLKNEDRTIKKLPLAAWKNKTVYIPSSKATSFAGPWSGAETTSGPTLSVEVAKKYFKEVRTDTEVKDADGNVVGFQATDLKGVDLVLVGMRSPDNGTNFSKAGMIENAPRHQDVLPAVAAVPALHRRRRQRPPDLHRR
ncbi:hypothetical protein [Raineyella fluvialis]|uniref:Uncharacterized protein n=1 Tax=Raineyella fluvialis TaxID=2662261 RepID=A0A5Q2FEC8_9ACTN|nr:hypothetical protein [Raineyella fluvialis]QGF22616.1 hypothetical protein Rai3103_01780 [Raineyella fluvialis]